MHLHLHDTINESEKKGGELAGAITAKFKSTVQFGCTVFHAFVLAEGRRDTIALLTI